MLVKEWVGLVAVDARLPLPRVHLWRQEYADVGIVETTNFTLRQIQSCKKRERLGGLQLNFGTLCNLMTELSLLESFVVTPLETKASQDEKMPHFSRLLNKRSGIPVGRVVVTVIGYSTVKRTLSSLFIMQRDPAAHFRADFNSPLT